MMTTTNQRNVIHPVLVIEVEGIKCRALLDTGVSSSYISASITKLLRKKPVREEHKSVEMMFQMVNRKMSVYEVQMGDVRGKLRFTTEVNKVDRDVLLTLPNTKCTKVIEENLHLRGIVMDDIDQKEQSPDHVILGANDYALIKRSTANRVAEMGLPIAEKTKLGWVIMSPG